MTSRSDINDLLRPGAIVPVDAQTTQMLVEAAKKYRSRKHYSQAFPRNTSAQMGMTLRDYFAAHAMQGMMVMPLPDAVDNAPKFLAKTAYGIADAMLEARDATP